MTPFRIAAGSSANALRPSSGRNPRSKAHLRSSPEQNADRFRCQAAPQRWLRCAAGISSAASWRSTVRAFQRKPAARARSAGVLGESQLFLSQCGVVGMTGIEMIVVSPCHPARPTSLAVRRLRRTVTVDRQLKEIGSLTARGMEIQKGSQGDGSEGGRTAQRQQRPAFSKLGCWVTPLVECRRLRYVELERGFRGSEVGISGWIVPNDPTRKMV